MKANVGGLDRVVRVVLGLALMFLAWNGNVGPWAWLGAIFVVTAGLSFCPLYKIFGINTCPINAR